MKIYTKNIGRKIYFYTTFNGFDYSEGGDTILQAKTNLSAKLQSVGARFEDMEFLEPTIQVDQKSILKSNATRPYIRYAKNRIDNL